MAATSDPQMNDTTKGRLQEDYDACIVGDEIGLHALRNAIDEALQNGESSTFHLDEFTGVKKQDTAEFPNPDESDSRFEWLWIVVLIFGLVCSVIGFLVLIVLLAKIFLGHFW